MVNVLGTSFSLPEYVIMLDPQIYTVGWICAITTELVAAQSFLDEEHDDTQSSATNDNNTYVRGKIGNHNVVIAVLPHGEYGTASAAIVARDMLRSFPNVRIGLMVGIGGGAPSPKHDIRLGDVVVSSRSGDKGGVFQYDFGKTIQNQAFQETGFLNQSPTVLRTAVGVLEARYEMNGHNLEDSIESALKKIKKRKKYSRPAPDTDRLYRSSFEHLPSVDNCSEGCGDDPTRLVTRDERDEEDDYPAIHYGLIASANQVMKDAITRDKLAAEKGVLCFEMEAAGLMNHFPCIVIRGICDYSDSHKNKEWQGFAAMAAAAYAKDLLLRVAADKVEEMQRAVDKLNLVHEDTQIIKNVVASLDTTTSLNQLPIAEGASFDSRAEEGNETCLPNTRVELLEKLSVWIAEPSSKPIFWLNGMAGTGKSTVARTLAQVRAEANDLGATFFFKRGETDRTSLKGFVATLARQLATNVPGLDVHIKAAIDADSTIVDKRVQDQFRRLIIEPLSKVSKTQSSLVFVIDALDECEEDSDVSLLIRLFSTAQSTSSRLRIFITSRPELPIRLGFNDIKGAYEGLVLHEIPAPAIEHDITVFLRQKLDSIKRKSDHFPEGPKLPQDWPGEAAIQNLVMMAIPLFIFASTICRLIVASASYDETVRIWSTETGKCEQVLQGHSSSVNSVVFSHDSELVASASDDNTTRVWDTKTGECKQLLKGHSNSVNSLMFSHNSELVATASGDKTIRIWSTGTGECQLVLGEQGNLVQSVVALSPNFSLVALASEDNTVRIWSTGTGECKQILEGHGARVYLMKFSHDSKLVALSKDPGTVQIWNLNTASSNYKVRIWCTHTASTSMDASIRIWNITSSYYRDLERHSDLVGSVALSPDFKLGASGSRDSTVRIWDTDIGDCMVLNGHSDSVGSVEFSHDSKLVASASDDDTVRIWSIDTGECMVLEGHSDAVHSVIFSHDSKLVSSASADNTVRIWRIDTGECIQVAQVASHNEKLCFNATDTSLFTSDGTVPLDFLPGAISPTTSSMIGSSTVTNLAINKEMTWITWRDKKILWLPTEC
ncbi:hypothetical protein MKX08_005639, partial [Trichoderma sp. CBMAI-0020]